MVSFKDDPAAYGQAWAADYDTLEPRSDTDATVAFVLSRTRGRVIEAGAGTGRVALPLAEAGIEVVAVDASPAMLDQLRSKITAPIPVTTVVADLGEWVPDNDADVVLIAYSTLVYLITKERQQRAVSNLAVALRPGGCLIVHQDGSSRADIAAKGPYPNMAVEYVTPAGVEISFKDCVDDGVVVHSVVIRADGTMRVYPTQARPVDADEMDEFAAVAGLVRHERFADFAENPYDPAAAGRYVTVYKAAGAIER